MFEPIRVSSKRNYLKKFYLNVQVHIQLQLKALKVLPNDEFSHRIIRLVWFLSKYESSKIMKKKRSFYHFSERMCKKKYGCSLFVLLFQICIVCKIGTKKAIHLKFRIVKRIGLTEVLLDIGYEFPREPVLSSSSFLTS
jgi:hypothetical protein